MTYTDLINEVLVKLRENQIASPNDTEYSQLIGQFVNEAKREVEDAWKWNALRTTIPIATVASTAQYSVTGAGKRFKLQDSRFSVYDTQNKRFITQAPSAWVKEQALLNTSDGLPEYYYFEGIDVNGDPLVNLWRSPNGVFTINFDLVVPQADFTLGTEVLSVPDDPVILGAYSKAVAERGEDDGRTAQEAISEYRLSVTDAISMDVERQVSEEDWFVV